MVSNTLPPLALLLQQLASSAPRVDYSGPAPSVMTSGRSLDLADPSAAMFGYGAPPVYWHPGMTPPGPSGSGGGAGTGGSPFVPLPDVSGGAGEGAGTAAPSGGSSGYGGFNVGFNVNPSVASTVGGMALGPIGGLAAWGLAHMNNNSLHEAQNQQAMNEANQQAVAWADAHEGAAPGLSDGFGIGGFGNGVSMGNAGSMGDIGATAAAGAMGFGDNGLGGTGLGEGVGLGLGEGGFGGEDGGDGGDGGGWARGGPIRMRGYADGGDIDWEGLFGDESDPAATVDELLGTTPTNAASSAGSFGDLGLNDYASDPSAPQMPATQDAPSPTRYNVPIPPDVLAARNNPSLWQRSSDWLGRLADGDKGTLGQMKLGLGALGLLDSMLNKGGRGKLSFAQLQAMTRSPYSGWNPSQQAAFNAYFYGPQRVYTPPPKMARGGALAVAHGGSSMPARFVHGPGGGQDDAVPIRASDGEYVLDADTVSALGDGSSDQGAQVLDHMREQVRAHKRSAPPNKIPPRALSPLAYMAKKG